VQSVHSVCSPVKNNLNREGAKDAKDLTESVMVIKPILFINANPVSLIGFFSALYDKPPCLPACLLQ
jgi:hypothetical protein